MKLDTSKITGGVAVHCPKKEYVRPLFEAMGLQDEFNIVIWRWHDFTDETCFVFEFCGNAYANDWGFEAKKHYEKNGYTIIPFEDLIIHKESKSQSKLAKALGVKDDEPFRMEGFNNAEYRIHNNQLESRFLSNEWQWESFNVNTLIKAEILPINRWTPEEQRMAEKDSFRFGWVARDGNGNYYLYTDMPEWNESIKMYQRGGYNHMPLDNDDYPSLQPGECVSLKEIKNG